MMRISLLNSLRGFAARSCRTGPLRGQSNFTFALNLQPNGMFVRRGTAPVMIGGISSIRLNATTPACGEILEQSVGMAASPVPAYKSEEIVDIATTSTVGRWAEDAAQYTQDVQSMGELAAGGLAGYSPVGLLQQVFEFLHVSAGLPWWGAIAVAGLTIRMLMYPLVIKAQQNSARMSNIAPEMEKISKNMREANMSGQSMAAGMEMAKLQALLESNNISMARNFLPLAQAPVFISFFIALRQMANLPVESMKSGGMFWFSDLTVPDPYLLLPVMSVCTMLLVMEVGAEGGVNVERLRKMKWVFRGMAVITFPIMVKMPVVSRVCRSKISGSDG